ncbi:KH domain-containing, RNA-binding, signal transduction-associated protein 3 isoform X2 [Ceratitis capitata]|uniref:KH domain-containing, RNA-binding, signal transduction-associated protein 3 isoform X2 n=1 Tax=Ceratitis capitata TaxID=7213 RepID=UPI000A0F77AE|nr:KH domain-containing, RNA-binding, signal transduction-associated protein 3 isoform X2 [Ceratitis capitata]
MANNYSEDHVAQKEDYDGPRINGVAQKFLADLNEERERLGNDFPLCLQVIDDAVERVYMTGRIPGTEYLADVYKQKPMKITQKVFVPVKQYPKFNFTGKLLGPKGNSLRRLHEETQCKIIIKGRGSMRDRNKEEELRQSSDPQHAHLNRDLFIEISTVATPAEAHARIAYALAEIRKYLIPDKNDDVSQEQLRELMEIDPKTAATYSKTVLTKFSNGNGASKFLNLIKQNVSMDEEEGGEGIYEEMVEYEQRVPKRTTASPYIKAISPPLYIRSHLVSLWMLPYPQLNPG